MHKDTILYLTFVLAVVSLVLHQTAELLYLYWTYWWYDILLHFLVGFTGALGLYWGVFRSGLIFRREFKNKMVAIVVVLVCTMAWGVAWEVYEYINEIFDSNESHAIDTTIDLILDASGAVLAVSLATRERRREDPTI